MKVKRSNLPESRQSYHTLPHWRVSVRVKWCSFLGGPCVSFTDKVDILPFAALSDFLSLVFELFCSWPPMNERINKCHWNTLYRKMIWYFYTDDSEGVHELHTTAGKPWHSLCRLWANCPYCLNERVCAFSDAYLTLICQRDRRISTNHVHSQKSSSL